MPWKVGQEAHEEAHIVSVLPAATMANVQDKIAAFLGKRSEGLRLCLDGVRVLASQPVTEAMTNAGMCLDVFEEKIGGGSGDGEVWPDLSDDVWLGQGSQDSPVRLEAEETEPVGEDCLLPSGETVPDEAFEASETEADEDSVLASGETVPDVVRPAEQIAAAQREVTRLTEADDAHQSESSTDDVQVTGEVIDVEKYVMTAKMVVDLDALDGEQLKARVKEHLEALVGSKRPRSSMAGPSLPPTTERQVVRSQANGCEATAEAASYGKDLSMPTINSDLERRFAQVPRSVETKVNMLFTPLDEKQRRALHGILCVQPEIAIVSGPAGAGKSALLKILTLLEEENIAVVTPTNGARAADQDVIDCVLPRRNYMPRVEVNTTFSGFGVGFKEEWDADKVVAKIKAQDSKKAKAIQQYNKDLLVVDEGAQVYNAQIDMQRKVRPQVTSSPHSPQRVVILMDAVQTPPVVDKDARENNPGSEMLWDGNFYKEAAARGQLAKYGLENVYSTDDAKLKALAKALRDEDFEEAWPLVQEFSATPYDDTFTDIVHDNDEVYAIAQEKHGGKPEAQLWNARCEQGGPDSDLTKWPAHLIRQVRKEAKVLVQMVIYPGQHVRYEPFGKKGAKTDSNWYLSKGELCEVVKHYPETKQTRVRCLKLKGQPLAWVPEEEVLMTLKGYGSLKLWAPPWRYPDIVTAYSGQGSRFERTHVHAALGHSLGTAPLCIGGSFGFRGHRAQLVQGWRRWPQVRETSQQKHNRCEETPVVLSVNRICPIVVVGCRRVVK